jgi:hypothetical protein
MVVISLTSPGWSSIDSDMLQLEEKCLKRVLG